MADRLVIRSIEIIHANQALSGAYIASPNFPTYRYAWFRDGSFTAYAMDGMGEHESAARFHDWAAATILRHARRAQAAMVRVAHGQPLTAGEGLHTRYTLDGAAGTESWPNFQLDGLGTWLWASVEHLRRTGDRAAAARWQPAMDLTAEYLAVLWSVPNYDCWEEFGERVHSSTLAALYGGLRALAEWRDDPSRAEVADRIRALVLEQGVYGGRLVKCLRCQDVDASLVGAAVPYGLLPPDDPRMVATVQQIERDLRGSSGGLHRYRADSYYGGGEWLLLTAWLGWYYAAIGQRRRAEECLDWVEAQANANGELPEQVPVDLNRPEAYSVWLDRWGPIAQPLLWSHAKYLILWEALHG